MLISSSTFGRDFFTRDSSGASSMLALGALYAHSLTPLVERRMTLSDTISVLYRFTPAVSSQFRVLRYHSI